MDKTALEKLATLIRYYILTSTTQAGSGHATSSLSAVEIAVTLFFRYLRSDLDDPAQPANDRFILSKGHASPLLYALYAVAGKLSEKDLLGLRTFDSPLEGHPSMRFPFTEVPTGSLGQGLSVGIGEALALRMRVTKDKLQMVHLPIIYVLMGDGELAEGQVWEAIQYASYKKVNNIIALIDVNRLGQSGETQYGHDMQTIAKRIAGFGWRTYIVENGHDLELTDKAFAMALEQGNTSDVPAAILFKTIKGKGVTFWEDSNGWHGVPVPKEELRKALEELGPVDTKLHAVIQGPQGLVPEVTGELIDNRDWTSEQKNYGAGKSLSTRKAFGIALARLGHRYPNVVVLDGDVQNSSYASEFAGIFPDRFLQMFIAEQNMVSVALGMAKQGLQPVVSTFGCFLTRAADQLRMAALSNLPMIVNGTHGGVSIGADGPSQMGLEDIALFRALLGSTVVYPADAFAVEALLEELLKRNVGIGYIRTTRPTTLLIYSKDDQFPIGGSKTFSGENDTVAVVAAGITVHEALKAQKQLSGEGIGIRVIDCYSIKPIDTQALEKAADETKGIIVVEDHYPQGGLGEAVLSALAQHPKVPIVQLNVSKPARSGTTEELLAYEALDAAGIIKAVHTLH